MENKIRDAAKQYNLRERISSLGFTQAEIADYLGIHRVSFSKMLIGNPTISTLTNIANYMQVPLYRLFMSEEEEIQLGLKKEEKVVDVFISSATGKKYKVVEMED